MAPLQQGDSIPVWMLCDVTAPVWHLEALFTHKVQAESTLRSYQTQWPDLTWRIFERRTEPHDNHC